MTKTELHALVDSLGHTNWHVKALVHCLIELGQVERLECQYENCILDSRSFRPRAGGRGHESYSLALDHIDPRMSGGSNHPENLRLIHSSCNVSRGLRPDTPETLAKRRAARAAFLASDRADAWREGMRQRKGGWNRATSATDRRGGMPGLRGGSISLTPEQVREMRLKKHQGETIKALAVEYGVGRSTAHKAIRGKAPYDTIE
ncbi:HNH endonuclease [Streptomyces sp. NPDC002402]